jgi:multimeric flavodoxin WrbA
MICEIVSNLKGDITMKVMAFNGSPRKKWNTATLLEKALEGAASQGAKTELLHLYDLSYKGCISCFACKTIGGKSYGRCVVKDDLKPIFRKIEKADAIILGSPIYWGTVSGEMKSFMERLLFQFMTYTDPPGSLLPRKI